MIKKGSIIIALLFLTGFAYSQSIEKDSSRTIPYLSISYQFFVPGGDLADRFGAGNIVGGDFNVKMENNFELGIGGGYIFGNQVSQDSLLYAMKTSSGEILDDNAVYADVFYHQRGWKVGISFSKIFPVLSPNYNSGIKVGVAAGYNQNWIRIEHKENTIPQLSDEFKTYYDRKAGGIYIEQFIGYQLFSNKGIANFLGGFEFRQAFNSPLRSYNIDDMAAVPSGNRVDLYFGVKVAWNIVFSKRISTGYYYN